MLWMWTTLVLVGCPWDRTGPRERPQVAWHTRLPFSETPAFWIGRPAVDGGRLFVQDGNLAIALDAATGAVAWSRPVRRNPSAPPTRLLSRDGRLYISEVDSVLALDGATGRTIWNFRPEGPAVVSPAVDASSLYTGLRNGPPVVYAVNLADGTLRWRTPVGTGFQYGGYVQGLAVSGDTVYATLTRPLNPSGGLSSGVLVALDRRDGHELWRWETSSGVHNFVLEPVVAGRVVLTSDISGKAVHAIDPATRQEAWRADLPNNGGSRLFLENGTVYVAGAGGFATAIDVATGKVRWSRTGYTSALGGAFCGSGFYMNEERLVRFDAATGKETGHLSAEWNNTFTSDVATDGERVYLTGFGGAYAVSCR